MKKVFLIVLVIFCFAGLLAGALLFASHAKPKGQNTLDKTSSVLASQIEKAKTSESASEASVEEEKEDDDGPTVSAMDQINAKERIPVPKSDKLLDLSDQESQMALAVCQQLFSSPKNFIGQRAGAEGILNITFQPEKDKPTYTCTFMQMDATRCCVYPMNLEFRLTPEENEKYPEGKLSSGATVYVEGTLQTIVVQGTQTPCLSEAKLIVISE